MLGELSDELRDYALHGVADFWSGQGLVPVQADEQFIDLGFLVRNDRHHGEVEVVELAGGLGKVRLQVVVAETSEIQRWLGRVNEVVQERDLPVDEVEDRLEALLTVDD